MVRKFAAISLVLFTFSFFTTPGNTQGNPLSYSGTVFTEPATKIKFPKKLGGLDYIGMQKYPHPALGVSLRYSDNRTIKADIYIYNMGVSNIGHNTINSKLTRELANAFKQIKAMEQRGHYQNVRIASKNGKLKILKSKIRNTNFISLPVKFTQVDRNSSRPAPRESYIYITSRKNQFVKVRFTYTGGKKNVSKRYLQAFISSLSKALR